MRIIAHLDMDAFFAAVEERDYPELKGRPIVVGADPVQGKGRGVVSTANYAARQYGIHSALPISTAWRLAEKARARGQPETVFLGVNYRRYREVSGRIMALVRRYAPVGEQETFGEDTRDPNLIFDRLLGMCGSVWKRMLAEGFQTFRTVVVTIRCADFDTHSRSQTLAAATDSPARLRFLAMKLLMPFLDRRENPRRKLLRLIGVRLEKLEK